MASGQTKHYGLNQWQAGDQVLREEFDTDNVKIDAALAALAAEAAATARANLFIRLAHISLGQDVPQIDLDLSGWDLTQYQALILYGSLVMASADGVAALLCNGITDGYGMGDSGGTTNRLTTLLGGTAGCPGSHVSHLNLGPDTICCTSKGGRWKEGEYGALTVSDTSIRMAPAQLHTLNLVGWGRWERADILAGSRFSLYGLKK